jgi:hypothetical protein
MLTRADSQIIVLAKSERQSALKDTIRGFTADLLFVAEAAYVPDTVYMAARPMLASTDGGLVIVSTANEPMGFLWSGIGSG